MRRQLLGQSKRRNLIWYGIGFFVVQLGLAVGIDQFWPAIRDPDYAELETIIRDRCAAAPNRPLGIILGSSRSMMGIDAKHLARSGGDEDAVVVNCASLASGPTLHQVYLRRLLAAGIHPDFVVLELMPTSICHGRRGVLDGPNRPGVVWEDRRSFHGRYSLQELQQIWPQCERPLSAIAVNWGRARVLPCALMHREALHNALAVDCPVVPTPNGFARDDYGWVPGPSGTVADPVARANVCLPEFADLIASTDLSSSVLQVCRETIQLCLQNQIRVVLFVPPESETFRNYRPAAIEVKLAAIRRLADEMQVPLVNAHNWIADECFADGHHLTQSGTQELTKRLGRTLSTVSTAQSPDRLKIR